MNDKLNFCSFQPELTFACVNMNMFLGKLFVHVYGETAEV